MTIAEKSFVRLTQQMKRCEKCKDLPKDSHAVFAGKFGNRIIVIGQAPGKQELKHDKPFCGPAGKRLFKWLAEIDIGEEEFRNAAYFTQMMKCYPDSTDRGDLKPNPKQLLTCASYLEEEFKLLRPELVIPVGKLAIEKLLGKIRLEEVVGKKFFKKVLGELRTIIPLPHPSGASPWSFKNENQKRIVKAIKILEKYYVKLKNQ
ncbi:MAG: uracil-DNA glycosylase [candidate division WOR-3 bacterium]|nr:uracil-DNA glycosylase [candidate division WOR-3 bacterium]MDH5683253.1 uracil-DNA glycosylase [candidate division WOR-3 bacterium]